MKIGIVGNYGHANLGDEALLLGAIECIRSGRPGADIVILSDDREDTEARLSGSDCEVRQLRRPYGGRIYRLPFVALDIYRALKGLDWLVFGGGGLLNDSNRTAIPLFVIVRVMAWLRGVRVAWWSVGIGPLRGRGHRRLARWLLSTSRFVTVRDEESAREAARMLQRRFKVTPDLAHAVDWSPRNAGKSRLIVAVSVVPYRRQGTWFEANEGDYEAYRTRVSRLIRSLLAARPDLDIALFPVSLEQDEVAIRDILAIEDLADDERVSEVHPESVADLLSHLSEATVVVATRLHSVVLASLAGVPSVTVAYQPKVASYAEELPVELPCFAIDDFSVDEVVAACFDVIGRADALGQILRTENEQRRRRLDDAVATWNELT